MEAAHYTCRNAILLEITCRGSNVKTGVTLYVFAWSATKYCVEYMHDSFVRSMSIIGINILKIDQDIPHDEPVAKLEL